MQQVVAVLMDPIEKMKIYKDSSFAMLLEAQRRGYALLYLTQNSLHIKNNRACALAQTLRVFDDPAHFYQLGAPTNIALGEIAIIFSRKDPPFDTQYLHDTHVLDLAEREGALVVNRPQSVRDCNEKLFALHFPQCTPKTLVARDATLLKAFVYEHEQAVAKSLDGMGGSAIFRVSKIDPNLNVIFETLTHEGRELALVQQFIPEIKDGDKRILMINGAPIPYALARIPQGDEFRGNLARGGVGRAQPLSARDLWIAEQVGPELKRRGLYFVGLDVIGDYLTEINVTSPTCIRELDAAFNINIAGMLFEELERIVSTKSHVNS
jgi:glutathione synthase